MRTNHFPDIKRMSAVYMIRYYFIWNESLLKQAKDIAWSFMAR
jgi:hypothetical protein